MLRKTPQTTATLSLDRKRSEVPRREPPASGFSAWLRGTPAREPEVIAPPVEDKEEKVTAASGRPKYNWSGVYAGVSP